MIPIVRREQRRHPAANGGSQITRKEIRKFILLGVAGQVVAQLFVTWGVRWSLASNAALLMLVLPMVIFLNVLTRLDATQAGLSNYLIPFLGVIIAAVALGERLTAFMIVGGVLVLASTLLVTVYEERRRASESVKV